VNDRRGIPIIHRWSTADVGPARRLDYYAAATSAALVPVTVSCDAAHFDASVERAELGPLDVLRMKGSAHDVLRNARDIARSEEHRYYVMLNVASRWRVAHRRSVSLAPGEAVFIDSAQPYDLRLQAYELVTLDLPAEWVHRWVHRPELLAGRCLSRGSASGRALAAMLPQLTPRFAIDPPIPGHVIANQIGTLLALAEAESSGVLPKTGASCADGKMYLRLHELMAVRCGEPALDARAVASALGVRVQEVTRALALHGESFAMALASRRAGVAARMLKSRAFARVPVGEIAVRAGFANERAMADALRAYPPNG
jgi:AraC-like DNA-binding protein